MIIKADGCQPESVIRILAGSAVEILIDDVGTQAFVGEEPGHIGHDVCAAPHLVGFAAIDAHEGRAFEIVGGCFSEHLKNLFRRYAHNFHSLDACVAISCYLCGHARDEMNIDGLDQFRMA